MWRQSNVLKIRVVVGCVVIVDKKNYGVLVSDDI